MKENDDIDIRIIECIACNQKHKLTIVCEHEISYSFNPFAKKQKVPADIRYTLTYTCPIKDMLMELSLSFDNTKLPQFRRAKVLKVE